MKDFDTWFYVIAFVLYMVVQIWRGYKKTKNAPAPPQKQRQEGNARDWVPGPVEMPPKPAAKKQKKRFSFDDLLKEFEESFEESKPPAPAREISEQDVFKDYSETESPETDYADHEWPSTLQPEVTKKNPIVKDQKDEIKFGRSEDYKILEKIENPYSKILKEPDGLKKAVILSEILNRKYF